MKRKDEIQRREAVVKLVAYGKSNKEIAHKLDMTFDSVVHNVTRAFKEYGVSNRVLLALKYHNIFTGV